MVAATRRINCFTERSRCSVPITPWKYLETTMLVAVCDQVLGTSTSFCSKITLPFSSVMPAERSSHSTSSKGGIPSFEKKRFFFRPPLRVKVFGLTKVVCDDKACWTGLDMHPPINKIKTDQIKSLFSQ